MHLNDMEKETGRLQVIIREADADKRRQQKELDQVITERDILGTQLGKNNYVYKILENLLAKIIAKMISS